MEGGGEHHVRMSPQELQPLNPDVKTQWLQVVEVEALKQVVTDKLGCGPNFKYHYRLDEDRYEG